MSTNHDAVAALPAGSPADKVALRNLLTKRLAYVLADADTVTDLVAVDPSTGAAIVDILYLGRVFHYDATDTTTANDGVTCLVTNDGRRYKLANGTDVFAYAVLDRDLSAPPVSPSIGDAYLVAAGATGAWAGKSNKVAVYTIRGWEFVDFGIGRFLYIEDIDSYYHKNAAGTWIAGFGTQTLSANSVPLSATINFGKRLIVENQTTTSPPGSPTVGTAYVIGPSATGGWAGQDGKIAICEVTGSFVIYTPSNGWEAYDKARSLSFTYTGSVWASTQGAIVSSHSVFTASGTGASRSGSTFYGYSDTSAPSGATLSGCHDSITIAHTAKRAGGSSDFNLVFHYRARITLANTTGVTEPKDIVVALFRDAETTALDWVSLASYSALSATQPAMIDVTFEIPANNNSAHTYRISLLDINANMTVQSITRRLFSVTERA